MGPLDAFWHLLNLFAVPALTGVLAATGAKLLWRRQLAPVGWRPLVVAGVGSCALVAVAGLVVFGRDGRMATYGAMVLACARTLWWRGWWRRGARR